jgi:hypothetical protein
LNKYYEPLEESQRRQIWEKFIDHLERARRGKIYSAKPGDYYREMDNNNPCGIDFEEVRDAIPELAKKKMNGREIRNAITLSR